MPTQTDLMTGAELATTRIFLGFSLAQLADYLWGRLPERPEPERRDARTAADLSLRVEQWERQLEATHLKIAETQELISAMARHGVATVGDLPEDIRPKRPTQQTSANLLRRLQRMEREEAAVPAAIVDELDEMYEVATNLVNNLVLQYKAKVKKAEETGEDVVLLTQRDGDDHKSRYPACWHRAVAARVAGAVPGLIIEYGEYDAEV